jgi:predicted transcriptional regulator
MIDEKNNVIEMAADIVSAYVANNSVSANDLPSFIKQVHDALRGISTGASEARAAPQTPAVSVRKSISADFLVCLEDGRKFKSLKRHLRTKYDMSPEDYRAKWGLPKDYQWSPQTTPRRGRRW